MPKHLPKPLEPTLPLFDQIINQQSQTLAGQPEAKVSVSDLTRLYQLRLELTDRFEAANPRPSAAVWVNPAWALPEDEHEAAREVLDRVRQEFEEIQPEPPAEEQPGERQ